MANGYLWGYTKARCQEQFRHISFTPAIAELVERICNRIHMQWLDFILPGSQVGFCMGRFTDKQIGALCESVMQWRNRKHNTLQLSATFWQPALESSTTDSLPNSAKWTVQCSYGDGLERF